MNNFEFFNRFNIWSPITPATFNDSLSYLQHIEVLKNKINEIINKLNEGDFYSRGLKPGADIELTDAISGSGLFTGDEKTVIDTVINNSVLTSEKPGWHKIFTTKEISEYLKAGLTFLFQEQPLNKDCQPDKLSWGIFKLNFVYADGDADIDYDTPKIKVVDFTIEEERNIDPDRVKDFMVVRRVNPCDGKWYLDLYYKVRQKVDATDCDPAKGPAGLFVLLNIDNKEIEFDSYITLQNDGLNDVTYDGLQGDIIYPTVNYDFDSIAIEGDVEGKTPITSRDLVIEEATVDKLIDSVEVSGDVAIEKTEITENHRPYDKIPSTNDMTFDSEVPQLIDKITLSGIVEGEVEVPSVKGGRNDITIETSMDEEKLKELIKSVVEIIPPDGTDTYYIDPRGGSDENDGLTESTPVKTPNAILNKNSKQHLIIHVIGNSAGDILVFDSPIASIELVDETNSLIYYHFKNTNLIIKNQLNIGSLKLSNSNLYYYNSFTVNNLDSDNSKFFALNNENKLGASTININILCNIAISQFYGGHINLSENRIYNFTNSILNEIYINIPNCELNMIDCKFIYAYNSSNDYINITGTKVTGQRTVTIEDFNVSYFNARFSKLQKFSNTNVSRINLPGIGQFYYGQFTADSQLDRLQVFAGDDSNFILESSTSKLPTLKLKPATNSSLGGVKPDGTTITITDDGTISSTGGGGGSEYTLPIASSDTLGGVKIGDGIDIDSDGKISVDTTGLTATAKLYPTNDTEIIYYIDPVNGKATNPGTSGLPFDSIATALSKREYKKITLDIFNSIGTYEVDGSMYDKIDIITRGNGSSNTFILRNGNFSLSPGTYIQGLKIENSNFEFKSNTSSWNELNSIEAYSSYLTVSATTSQTLVFNTFKLINSSFITNQYPYININDSNCVILNSILQSGKIVIEDFKTIGNSTLYCTLTSIDSFKIISKTQSKIYKTTIKGREIVLQNLVIDSSNFNHTVDSFRGMDIYWTNCEIYNSNIAIRYTYDWNSIKLFGCTLSGNFYGKIVSDSEIWYSTWTGMNTNSDFTNSANNLTVHGCILNGLDKNITEFKNSNWKQATFINYHA